ncbi:MAG: acyl-CoA dehydrogenase family protein, partial [Candidatus Krumholzibacteria bacterium]|nr:acyl-CoA dehydrogenase family protein [Candidatus Krumholzibacteria bacterium]
MSHWLDLYRMDDLLSEEERIIQRTVRDFVEKEALPHLPELWEKGEFPRELASRMGEIGLFGPTLSGYGLPGLGSRAYGLMMLELERGDSGLRSFASVQGSLCMYPIHRFGSEEQKTRWLPELASGKKIACFGLTEPDSGSDPGGMKTRATKDGDDWLLQGSKMWITNGTLADLALVWAMTEDGIRGFLVEKGTPGFTADSIKGKMSLRASDTAELVLDEVRVPAEAMLPEARGLSAPLACLTQ